MFPNRRVGLASYEADFAASWGRKTRDVLEEFGPKLYGIRLREDSRAANRWDIEQMFGRQWVRTNGGMFTAGVGGPFTGKGAHLLIIDDPVKNAEESLSLTQRQKADDWYRAVARTRLEPGGVIIPIMTRWHERDLAGVLQDEQDKGGEQWTVLRLPALAEPDDPLGRAVGTALWPE